jgi:hypothetical protein
MNIARPSINIYIIKQAAPFVREVLAGLEEEGVLYDLHISSQKSAQQLAHSAASASILEVGIGIDKEWICVTLAKFSEEEPLLKYRVCEEHNLRLSGTNAARLVKGNRLKL